MNKAKISIFITILLPVFNTVNAEQNNFNNGYFLLEDSSLNKIIYDGNDTSILTGNNLIPKNSQGDFFTENNVVHIIGTPLGGLDNIYGGYCNNTISCNTSDTSIIMDNGSANNIYGARSDVFDQDEHNADTSSTGRVYLNGGTINNNIYGAYSEVVTTNTSYIPVSHISNVKSTGSVYLNAGTIKGDVYGSRALTDSNTFGNFNTTSVGDVYLNGANVHGNIYGSYAYAFSFFHAYAKANATGNVYLNSGTVSGNIYGAYGDSASFNSGINILTNLQSNVSIFNDVKLQAINNITGTIEYKSEIWGGFSNDASLMRYQMFKGNTFEMGANPLIVTKMGNFENYNFYLNKYNLGFINTNTALVTVTHSLVNNDTALDNIDGLLVKSPNISNVRIAGISGENKINEGDTIVLIDANNAELIQNSSNSSTVKLSDLFNQPDTHSLGIQVGLVKKADIEYNIDDVNQKITATIRNLFIDEELANKNIKPFAEGRLAALMNATRGSDLILNNMKKHTNVGLLTPIAAISGGFNKYKGGSYIDTQDFGLVIGSRYQLLNNLYAGLLLEYGRSDYDTYNTTGLNTIKGTGHTYNYGISFFTKYNYYLNTGSIYTDAIFRFGKTSTKFESKDILITSNKVADYKSKANYISGMIGGGYIYTFNNETSLDTSIRYFNTRLGSDSVVIDGDTINFQSSVSSKIQLKEQFNYQVTDLTSLYFAGIYEYEFDGRAKTNVSGININAPGVRGSTGILELGVQSTPIASNQDIVFNMNINAFTGKRKGVNASISLQYNF